MGVSLMESKGIEKFWELWRDFWKEPDKIDKPAFSKWAKGMDSGAMLKAFRLLSGMENYAGKRPRLDAVRWAYGVVCLAPKEEKSLDSCPMCVEDGGWSWTTFDPMTNLPANPDNCSLYVFACKIPCTCYSGRAVCKGRGKDMASFNPWRRRHHKTRQEAEAEAHLARKKAGAVEGPGEGPGMFKALSDAYFNTVRFKADEKYIDVATWLNEHHPDVETSSDVLLKREGREAAAEAQRERVTAVQNTPDVADELGLENVGF